MKIAVTGRHGQIASSLVERGRERGHAIVTLGTPELDLERPETVTNSLIAARPDAIVSAAAYTAVDKAESEPDKAFAVNAAGAGAVAAAAAALRVPLVHLSTDFVFDGTKPEPYVEDDPTGPLGVYGASKLAGEVAVAGAHANSAILRTAWVYSPYGANFMKTMLRLAAHRDEIGVVADQIGNPSSAPEIAGVALLLCERLARDAAAELRGVFHLAGQGAASWAEFAEAIFAASARHGGPTARVRHIATADYPTPARRPANSRLDCERIARAHGAGLSDWPTALDDVITRYLS